MTSKVSAEYFAGLSKPFASQIVQSADGSSYSSGTPVPLLLAAALVVALVAGLAVQQAVYQLAAASHRAPHKATSSSPVPDGRGAVPQPGLARVQW